MRNKLVLGCLCFCGLQLAGCNKEEKASKVTGPLPHGSNQRPLSQTQNQKSEFPRKKRGVTVSINEESIQSKRLEISEELENLIGRPITELNAAEWTAIKQYYWTPSLDQNIAESDENSANRSVVELVAAKTGKNPIVLQLLPGKFTDIRDPAEQEFLIATHLLALSAAASGGRTLPEAAAARIADSNTTKGDLFIFEVFSDAFVEARGRNPMPQQLKLSWDKLAQSPNRLLRLLALRTFRRAETDPNQWLTFYRHYVNEQDQGIFNEAISLATQPVAKGSRDLLLEFRSNCTATTPTTTTNRIDTAIKWVEQCNTSSKE